MCTSRSLVFILSMALTAASQLRPFFEWPVESPRLVSLSLSHIRAFNVRREVVFQPSALVSFVRVFSEGHRIVDSSSRAGCEGLDPLSGLSLLCCSHLITYTLTQIHFVPVFTRGRGAPFGIRTSPHVDGQNFSPDTIGRARLSTSPPHTEPCSWPLQPIHLYSRNGV